MSKSRFEELSRRLRDKETELSQAEGKLEATKQEAREKHNTDDVDELEKKKQKYENQMKQLEDQIKELEDEIEDELNKIENEDDDE